MKKKRRVEWSKVMCILGVGMGFFIVQECFYLMYRMINAGYTASAAWLTAAVGVASSIIGACITGYLSLAKAQNTGASDKQGEGVTYAAAKAKNFSKSTDAEI